MKWVRVEEQMPIHLYKVLFLWVCPGGNTNVSMGYHCEQGWDIYLPYHSYKLHNERIKVTHWTELPEYAELSEEKKDAPYHPQCPRCKGRYTAVGDKVMKVAICPKCKENVYFGESRTMFTTEVIE
jgi:transcription initiation factor IIE alpha subunit